MNAIIYCRVSTKEQVEGNSLIVQESACLEFAKRNNYSINKIFREEGESAKTADRTELNRMMDYCKDHYKEIDALIIHKVDRLSRQTNDYLMLKLFFNHLKIRICSVSESLEDDPAGRFTETIFAAQAQFDNEVRAERSKKGMMEVVKSGRWPWLAPLGYINKKINGVNTIEPEVPYCDHIVRVFELIATGMYRPEEVRKTVTKEGLKQKNGKEVSSMHFHKIIRNKLYMGQIEAFGMTVEGNFERIIEPQLFYQVQDILEGRAKKMPKYRCIRPDFPLRGLLYDPGGVKISASWSTGRNGKFPYYHSKNVRSRKEKVEKAFASYLKQFEFDDSQVEVFRTTLRKKWEERNHIESSKRASLKKEIALLEEKKEKYAEKMVEGFLKDDFVQTLIGKIDNQIKEKQTELFLMSNFEDDIDEVVKYGLRFVTNFSERWQSIEDIEIKQRFQNFLFPAGLTYFGEEKFGTATLPLLIRLKNSLFYEKSTLAD